VSAERIQGARKGSRTIGERIGSLVNRSRSAQLDRRDAAERANAATAGPTVKERQHELIRFYQEYETLVETVCDPAQYGPTPKLEGRYETQRNWMIANYPGVRKYVVAYLRFDVEDVAQGGDAFEALFTAENLTAFLQSDDGNMISRIMRTREALSLYGDHLRQLPAAA